MFDTMTFTKAAGGICGALLVLLLGKWAAEGLYHMDGHGEAAYVIQVEGGEEVAEAEEVDFATILASADIDKGANVFRKCAACHKLVEGENAVGPYLYGVVNRDKGSVSGFNYSDTLASIEGSWTADDLNAFIEKPSAYAAGTSMSFAGLKKIEDRANLIAYLDSLDN